MSALSGTKYSERIFCVDPADAECVWGKRNGDKGNIVPYSTALLDAVERSVLLRGPSRLPVVNYCSIMTVAMHITTVAMHITTAVQESHVFGINPPV